MRAPLAAAYLDIGESSFLALVTRVKLKPVAWDLTSVRWRRADLDGLIDALASGEVAVTAEGEVRDDAADALQAVRSYGKQGGRKGA